MKLNTTWSPGVSHDTCSPTALTTPAPSCPPMQGSRIGMSPVTRWSSEWHMPEACNSNSTSSCVCTGIPSCLTNDGLMFDEAGDTLRASLAADAGLFEAPERACEV